MDDFDIKFCLMLIALIVVSLLIIYVVNSIIAYKQLKDKHIIAYKQLKDKQIEEAKKSQSYASMLQTGGDLVKFIFQWKEKQNERAERNSWTNLANNVSWANLANNVAKIFKK